MTRGQLVDTVHAALDERLIVDDPQPFGPGFIVTKAVVEGLERGQPAGRPAVRRHRQRGRLLGRGR